MKGQVNWGWGAEYLYKVTAQSSLNNFVHKMPVAIFAGNLYFKKAGRSLAYQIPMVQARDHFLCYSEHQREPMQN